MPGAASKKSFGVLMHEFTGSPVPSLPAPPDLTSAPADLRAPAAEYREQVENVIFPLIIDALAGPPEPGPSPAWTGRVPDLSPEALAEIDATMRMAEGWAFAAGAEVGFALGRALGFARGVHETAAAQADAQAHYLELTGLSKKNAKTLPDDFPWNEAVQAVARCHLPTDSLPELGTQGACPSTTMPHLLRGLGLLGADEF